MLRAYLQKRRGDQREAAGAGRQVHRRPASWKWTPSATAGKCSCPASWSMVERTGIHSGDSISVYPTFSVERQGQGDHPRLHPPPGPGHRHRGPLQHPVHRRQAGERLRHRGQPPLLPHGAVPLQGHGLVSWPTSPRACILGKSLKEQGITGALPAGRRSAGTSRCPPSRFSKLAGLDAYLSPEMKSTGEAIGYDDSLTRALYKALQASGMRGGELRHRPRHHRRRATRTRPCRSSAASTTSASTSRPPAAPRRFSKSHGIRTRVPKKISEGSEEILDSIRQGYVSYVINTRDMNSRGPAIRRLRDPPLRRGKQRDHVYRAGHGAACCWTCWKRRPWPFPPSTHREAA